MSLVKMNKNQQKVLLILTFVVLFLGIYFIRGYLMLIILSAILAILFNPVYSWFLKKGKSKGTASFYTFVVSALVVIIPITLVGIITFNQLQTIVETVANNSTEVDLNELGTEIVDSTNSLLEDAGIGYRLSVEELTDTVTKAASTFGGAVFNTVIDTFSGFFGLITAALIYIYVFLSMLKNRENISNIIKKLNPLGDEVTDIYQQKVVSMTKASVGGQFIIAIAQGFMSAAVIALVGPSDLFFFLFMLLTVMSVIPLGAGIITIPIGIVMALTGNITGGIIVIANHLLIVTNIDNVLRPMLVPEDARLDPALMILAVFSGLALFGFLGIVIGPVIMILVVTTIKLFLEVFYKEESIDRTKKKQKTSYYSKLKDKLSTKAN